MRRIYWLAIAAVSFATCDGLLAADGEQTANLTRPAIGIEVQPHDWPWWRGPSGNGVAAANQQPPLAWSATQNVLWKTPVPGRGHSSPTVVGDRIILTTADEEKEIQSVLCYDRATGKLQWQTQIHSGNLDDKGNKKASQASSSVACDGARLYVNFLNAGHVYTTALDLDGKQLWQTKVSDFVMHQGFGSSPALYQSLVFVTTDHKGGGVLAALDRTSGKIVWQEKRPATANYASPVVLHTAGKDQLLVSGCEIVAGFEPLSGKKLWEVPGSTTECVTTMVTDGQAVFVSGGYPKRHVQAILADGSGKTLWENAASVYVPSMIVSGGHLFAVQDSGIATCWNSTTGEEKWKSRVGGTFSGSLVQSGQRLYATNEAGKTFVFKADPAQFELLAENQLGQEAFATPTICGGRIYLRAVDRSSGQRQEMLYCVGEK